MIAIVIGFETMNKDSAAECLYCGADVAEALRVAENPGKDFARTAVFKDPEVYRRFVGPFEECRVISEQCEAKTEASVAEVAADDPVGDAPVGDAPAGDAPVGDAPAGDAPVGDVPKAGGEDKPLALQGLGAAVEKKKGK